MPFPVPITYPDPVTYPGFGVDGTLMVALSEELVLGATDAQGVRWTIPTFEGWDGSPGPTLDLTQRARGHGATASESFLTARYIRADGFLHYAAHEAFDAAAARLAAAVRLDPFQMLVSHAGTVRAAMAQRQGEVIVKELTDTIASYSILLSASDPRKFGDLVTAETLLPFSSGGRTYPASVVLRTNLSPNSALRTGTADWMSGGALNRVSFNSRWWLQAPAGTWTYAGGIGVTGSYYAASLRLNGTPGAVINFLSTDSVVGAWCEQPSVTIPAGGEIVVQMASTVAAAGTNLNFGVELGAGQTVKITEALIEKVSGPGVAPGAYLDGDMTAFNARTYAWTGAANASTSTETSTGGATYPLVYTGVSNTGIIRATNDGNEQAPVWLRIDGPIPAGGWTVTHTGKKHSLSFATSLALAAGEFVTVDMDRREVLAQGQSARAGYVTSRGWFSLDPGINDIAFSAANYNSAAKLTLTTRPAWS